MNEKSALVVDDSKSARFALRKYLEAHLYAVDTAGSAEEAFRYLADKRPGVIFLDHMMPGVDGFDVLKRIKGDPRTVTIPVVICSSNEGAAFIEQARSKGAADVLPKPPGAAELARVLGNLARNAGAAEPLPAAAPAPRLPPKVSPIREPEIAIEQAVLKAVRDAMPQPQPAAEPPALAAVPKAPPREDISAEKLAALREQMEGRLRKITQDLYVDIAEIKARVTHLDHETASRGPDAETTRELAQLRRQVEDFRGELDAAVQALERRFDEVLAAARVAAADEAHAVAERTVMNAATRISSQLAEGIVKVMMGGKG